MAEQPQGRGRGLSAAELALACAELALFLRGAEVLDAVPLAASDDLVLVVDRDEGKAFVHVALGQDRARVAPTARRFVRDEFDRGPRVDALKQRLAGARVLGVDHVSGERRCELRLSNGGSVLRLCIELFSARGLWALCTAAGEVLALSRPVETAVRKLVVGSTYAPPPPRGNEPVDPPPRFAAPVLLAIDAHFLPADAVRTRALRREQLQVHADRAVARAEKRAQGLRTQLAESDNAALLRAEADLMLAYMHTVKRGSDVMEVPDPHGDGLVAIDLDPALPIAVQAEKRYDKARRMDEGRAITAERLAAAEQELAAVTAARAQLLASGPDDDSSLLHAERELARVGAIPKVREPKTAKAAPKPKDLVGGENVRRFRSAEGYDILVGRDNHQNDKLTLRIAKGNDLWLHVGGGRPGSHVVVRLPKGKTASLETLLDAGTLAVHFSKARGERRIDVVYTFAKFVRKPKGLPPGAVVPSQTKTITVNLDEARRKRLLDGSEPE